MSSRFDATIYARRLSDAATLAGRHGLDALVITPGPDLRYLLGSRANSFERLTALVIPAAGKPSIVLPQLELASLKASAATELNLDVTPWVDGVNPYALVRQAIGASGAVRVGVTDVMPALHLLPLAKEFGATPVLATDVLRRQRMVKDAAEIEALTRAGAAIDRVHAAVPNWLVPGRTEREVAEDIGKAIVAEGHSAAEFIIVGSGPHGADPHHEVSDRMLCVGDVVVVDIGGPVEPGYNSDSTRTYVIGEPKAEVAQQVAALERAQRAAFDAVRPGVSAESIDEAARAVLRDAGLADVFVHRTGHGIGLSVHEEPYIVSGNDLVLEEGMAFSIEPGIYFTGQWGARIEDIVIVTADGAVSVNNQPHGLTIV